MARPKKTQQDTTQTPSIKKRATNPKSTKVTKKSLSFASHLKRIKQAKKMADEVSQSIPMDTCEASVALLWEIVFDNLCNAQNLSMSDFNTVAGIIQKLASTKIRDVTNKISTEPENTLQNFMLTEETLSKIESQLKML